jgi:uncharacterized protein
MQPAIPFHTYLWKIASRCNLACPYCYVYFLEDQGWQRQPKFMSSEVARQTARRMLEHLQSHRKTDASIIFHGGEPTLGGAAHLRELTDIIVETFYGSGIALSVGMQSNLLLFTEEIGDLMLERGLTIGVSCDGPPKVHDLFRIDHQGRGTSAEFQKKMALLTSPKYRPIFSGMLCVLNPETDPAEVTEYLLSFDPPGIDFLFPLDNHDRRPRYKDGDAVNRTPYGDWLVASFDYWRTRPNRTRIRIFNSIMNMMCGGASLVESLGLGAVDLILVETNGEIEGVDSLKSSFGGAATLGFNVFDHEFDRVAEHVAVRQRQLGAHSLSQTCQSCDIVHICGGGYLPHRYAAANGFDNPSVYCADLDKLIRHIHGVVREELSLISVGAAR